MTKADAIAKLEAAKAASPSTLTIRPNSPDAPEQSAAVSGDALDAALAWTNDTFDTIPFTGVYAAVHDEAVDFVYGVEPKWLAITVRGDGSRECTGLGVPGAYDGMLLNAANPTAEQVQEFFSQ